MSYKNPTAHVITAPVLLDKEIKNIQTALATLSWLEKSFGRAFKDFRIVDGRKVSYPAIFQEWKKDYYDAFPNDNIKSYSFIYADPSEITEYKPKHQLIDRNISIILFFDMEKIDNTFKYPFVEKLKEDVLIALSSISSGSLEVENITDEVEEVFNDFSISEIKAEFLKTRYGALKFDCKIFYQNDNCDLNTYTP